MTDLQKRTSLEVGDVLRAHATAYRANHPVSPEQAQVMQHLAACRTTALGGHVDACAGCGFTRISYNSCRDRHCPKCQAGKRAAWLETRLQRLLPIGYLHANSRQVSLDDKQVTFHWKDYADGHQTKLLSLSAEEFLRRFLLHVLPKGFVRIRHYGLLASINVASKLARCRQLLGEETQSMSPPAKTWIDRMLEWTGQDPLRCPQCQGLLERSALTKSTATGCLPAATTVELRHTQVAVADSS